MSVTSEPARRFIANLDVGMARIRRVVCPVALVCVLLGTGCRLEPEVIVTRLEVQRPSWDHLQISIAFARVDPLGRKTAVVPDTLQVHLFDAGFDTLYAGGDTLVAVPDAELGSEERLLLEVCGAYGHARVCEQRALTASPKRLQVSSRLDYPVDETYERGRYELVYTLERPRFGGDGWEPVHRTRPLDGYFRAYVGADERASVRVPVRFVRGQFDLSRLENYRDFKYALQSKLFEGKEAEVHFDLYAGLRGLERPVDRIARRIVKKSEAERMAEVGHFVEQAATKLVERLGLGHVGAYVFIEGWTYDLATRTYHVDLSLQWRRGWLRRWATLEGRLVVPEAGGEAVFHLRDDPQEEARRQWETHVAGEELVLDSLAIRTSGVDMPPGAAPPARRRDRIKTW